MGNNAPRLSHRKSRLGCSRCKARHVKCDEIHPSCSNCRRHKVPCDYPHLSPKRSTRSRDQHEETHGRFGHSPSSSTKTDSPTDAPESKARRLLELRLIHHYDINTRYTLQPPTSPDSVEHEIWSNFISKYAFSNDSYLHSIFSISALHLAKTGPSLESEDFLKTHQHYLDLALQCHRHDMLNLDRTNVDVASLTASLLRVCAFAMLLQRNLDPYNPPMQFLRLTTGALQVVWEAGRLVGDDENSVVRLLLNRVPFITDPNYKEALLGEANRQALKHLLSENRSDEDDSSLDTEAWDEEIEEAYASAVSYIGGVKIAMSSDNETPSVTLRRVLLFPVLLKTTFIELVEEKQPRALVVLAHFFALLVPFRDMWWISDAGSREIKAVHNFVGQKWEGLMKWPLAVVRNVETALETG